MSNAAAAVADTAKELICDKPKEPKDRLVYQQVEQAVDNEEEKIEEICKVVKKVIDKNVEKHMHDHRATRVKGLGYVKGTFIGQE